MLFAYIDPAIGSMILQAIAAIGLAGAVVCRRILLGPLAWITHGRIGGQDQKADSPPSDE
jgi:hypothetical protein